MLNGWQSKLHHNTHRGSYKLNYTYIASYVLKIHWLKSYSYGYKLAGSTCYYSRLRHACLRSQSPSIYVAIPTCLTTTRKAIYILVNCIDDVSMDISIIATPGISEYVHGHYIWSGDRIPSRPTTLITDMTVSSTTEQQVNLLAFFPDAPINHYSVSK